MQNKKQQRPPHPPHPPQGHPARPPRAAARGVETGAATKRENSNATEEGKQQKKAQGMSFDVPWAVGNFFSSHFIILLLTMFFKQVLSMLQQHYKPQAAMTRWQKGGQQ